MEMPKRVIGIMRTETQTNLGKKIVCDNIDRVWELRGDNYICDNPRGCVPVISVETMKDEIEKKYVKAIK